MNLFLSQFMKLGYLAHMQVVKCQTSLSKCTVLSVFASHKGADQAGWMLKLFSAFVVYTTKPGLKVIKLFPCPTQLSAKFIMLISVKMPTIVDILTFISMTNTSSERLKARNFFICRYFSFCEQLKFRAQLSWAWKRFYNLGTRPQGYKTVHAQLN